MITSTKKYDQIAIGMSSKDIKVGSLVEITDYHGNTSYDIVHRIFFFYEITFYNCCLNPGKSHDPTLKRIKFVQW